MSGERVFRLLDGGDWARARAAGPGGTLPTNADDRRDGFFHLSSRAQVAETARRYYAGVADLWAVELDPSALGDALRWEPSRGGALFPHVYGEVPVAAVIDARPFDSLDFA
jgi:uncharacterized protein (DUF952 family)